MPTITELIELNSLAKVEGGKYERKRYSFGSISRREGRHFTGIVGPRGVGKTIILKQIASADKGSFYISLDTLAGENLFEIVKKLHMDLHFETFLLDEVHFVRDFDGQLKKIFDFLDVRVVFTSSVALVMLRSAYDLSRRIRLVPLLPFSFREYLWFKTGTEVAPLLLENLIEGDYSPNYTRHAFLFDDYLAGGNMPFSLEEPDPLPLLKNVRDTILSKDIPGVASLRTEEIDLIRKTLDFIGRSEVDGINYSSISRNIGITKYKAEAYLQLLEQTYVVTRVFPAGTNVLKEPKVLMTPPFRLLYRGSCREAIGGLREDFVAAMLTLSEIPFYYLKSTRGAKTPDYFFTFQGEKIVFEVGGRGKGREQFKGVKANRKVVFSHTDDLDGGAGRRPLFLLGMLS